MPITIEDIKNKINKEKEYIGLMVDKMIESDLDWQSKAQIMTLFSAQATILDSLKHFIETGEKDGNPRS